MLHLSAGRKAARRQLSPVAAQKESGVEEAKKQVAEVADSAKGNLQQLLGIRGASETTNIWKIRLQLTKPVTWVPLIWGEKAETIALILPHS